MPSTNIGVFATDQEYSVMVNGFPQAGDFTTISREAFLIRMVEAAVRLQVNVRLAATAIEDEEISIDWPVYEDGVLVSRQTSFMLKESPVTAFTSLKIVTARSETTGLATTTATLPRNSYHVELATGIVRELQWSLMQNLLLQLYPYYGFPPGIMTLLASYSSGAVETSDQIEAIRLVCFMAVSRLYNQFTKNRWDIASQSFDGQSVTYLDVSFTKAELGHLQRLKKAVYPRNY